jgi:dihydroneopterin aldolase
LTDEIAQAFDHPERRARAMAGGDPPDRISLRDHVVAAEIGAFQQERGLTQRLRFNLAVELRPQAGAATDDVDLVLSYDRLTEAIAAELAAERLNLLETLAERIAARILAEPQALRVFLRIEKLDRGPGALGVEIVRSGAGTPPAGLSAAPRPVVALLSPDAPDLSGRLETLMAAHPALIVALAPPAVPRPEAATPAARRHIALLAVEQAALAIASRVPRLSVVATRTEIDWALKHGRPILWAPSKLMLDSADAPDEVGDGLAPALWLAESLNALKLVVHAPVAGPAESRVPIERG